MGRLVRTALAVIGAVLLLCGCVSSETQKNSTAATVQLPTTIPQTVQPTLPEESILPSEEPTEPPPPVTVYAGAIEDYLLPLEQFSWERLHAPEFVMIHFTSAVVNNRSDPYNMEEIKSIFVDYEISVHYIIERNGTIRCYIPEDRVAWHAGKGAWGEDAKYTNNMNQYAIGIELAAIGSQEDMSIYLTGEEYAALDQSLLGFTQEQYEALKSLVEDICGRYGIPMDREHVIGHEEYASRKTDPGELFDWEQLIPA